jgi:hypothetical protein
MPYRSYSMPMNVSSQIFVEYVHGYFYPRSKLR